MSFLPLSLNLLVFLFHALMGLVDEKHQLLRLAIRNRRKFFQHVETLLEHLHCNELRSLQCISCSMLGTRSFRLCAEAWNGYRLNSDALSLFPIAAASSTGVPAFAIFQFQFA